MLFLLATPEYNKIQSNITKVKVHLRNGIAEILDQHQDLMGKVENNLLEIETNFENKLEKLVYILQDAVFIVSNKGLDTRPEFKGTGVYIYARRVREINSSTSIDEIVKQYDQKSSDLEKELTKLESAQEDSAKKSELILNSKLLLLKEEVEFLRRTVTIVKSLRS
jgi:F0F1-type ATP synthase epsilon subunit